MLKHTCNRCLHIWCLVVCSENVKRLHIPAGEELLPRSNRDLSSDPDMEESGEDAVEGERDALRLEFEEFQALRDRLGAGSRTRASRVPRWSRKVVSAHRQTEQRHPQTPEEWLQHRLLLQVCCG